jgi:hypothetical protein
MYVHKRSQYVFLHHLWDHSVWNYMVFIFPYCPNRVVYNHGPISQNVWCTRPVTMKIMNHMYVDCKHTKNQPWYRPLPSSFASKKQIKSMNWEPASGAYNSSYLLPMIRAISEEAKLNFKVLFFPTLLKWSKIC